MDSPVPGTNTQRRRFRLLYRLEGGLEAPMFVLALVWLWLFIREITHGLTPGQETLGIIIWVAFVVEFLLKLFLAPRKWRYVRRNWLTLLALVVPAFRTLRLVRALRVLRASRVATGTRFVRALTSTNRFLQDLREAQGKVSTPEMNVGVLVAISEPAIRESMENFARQLMRDVTPEMEAGTGLKWPFHLAEPDVLDTDTPHRPADFLDEASLRMAEGPYDLVVVITDVGLISRRNTMEPALASPISHIIVLSTRRLEVSARGRPDRELSSPAVRWNAAALLLRQLGHISGLRRRPRGESRVMAPFEFRESRRQLPAFTEDERDHLHRRAGRLPERELIGGNSLASLIFHVLMAIQHPGDVLLPLARNWAILLPLSLPGLATAAIAPSLVLIFGAEMWDVALSMSDRTATIFTVVSILAATFYLVRIQSLFLPRKEKRVLTEHLALANVVIFLSILFACIGLLLMVSGIMFLIEIYIFPQDLMMTWPTIDQPEVTTADKIRLAVFIGAIGVLTGALAGGLESKAVIQHLALFEKEA